MEGLIIGALMVGIGLIIAAMRKGSSAVKTKPSRLMSFTTARAPHDVMTIVVRFAQQSGYKIDEIAESDGRILLSDSATATSWGFFYPVYVSKQNDGNSLVEVGIKSQLIQVGPIVSRNHERCFNGIKAAIFANT